MLCYDNEKSKISSYANAVLLPFVCLTELCVVPVMPLFYRRGFCFSKSTSFVNKKTKRLTLRVLAISAPPFSIQLDGPNATG